MRQLETALKKLQDAADSNDMRPIWQYQKKIRMTNMNNQAIIKKKDGSDCQGIEETTTRWGDGRGGNFSKEQDENKPQIPHITEQDWGQLFRTSRRHSTNQRKPTAHENDEEKPRNRRMAEPSIYRR